MMQDISEPGDALCACWRTVVAIACSRYPMMWLSQVCGFWTQGMWTLQPVAQEHSF